jgi:hypothetical protein
VNVYLVVILCVIFLDGFRGVRVAFVNRRLRLVDGVVVFRVVFRGIDATNVAFNCVLHCYFLQLLIAFA